MNVVIATGRQAHYRLPANAFVRRGCDVTLYTATPRNRMHGFDSAVETRWIPAPVAIFSGVTHLTTPLFLDELDSTLFDRCCALALKECDVLLGASTSSLATGKAAKRMGGIFVLDRACPDIRVQQRMLVEEARKAGGTFRTNSPWFIDRQVEEYEAADFILTPSDYSRRSYPEHLRKKMVLAPLYGRSKVTPRVSKPEGSPFVVGVVGGSPLRKGFLYLLQAWQNLALPGSQLKLRSSNEVFTYPGLKQLLADQKNVELIGYLDDIDAFYRECDAFILPSIDDGFGMVLLEALSHGIPAIATRNCGASELLVDGQDFLLIDACSVSQIESALLTLFESAETRERLSRNGPPAARAAGNAHGEQRYGAAMDELLLRITNN